MANRGKRKRKNRPRSRSNRSKRVKEQRNNQQIEPVAVESEQQKVQDDGDS